MIVITIKNQGINRSFLIYFFIKNKLNLMNVLAFSISFLSTNPPSSSFLPSSSVNNEQQ